MAKKLDIILFGATGFTGRHAAETLFSIAKEKGLSWGVAARNKDKLDSVMKHISDKRGADLTNVPQFIADVTDESSLKDMTSNARAIINCCGPYRFYGEQVVKACLATGTHHLDISGEPQYIEETQLNYHKQAEEKGIYILSACAFNSVVCDMGIVHMMDNFKGELNSVEAFLLTKYEGNIHKGAGIHYTTWECAVHTMQHENEMQALREKLFPKKLPDLTPKLQQRLLHKNSAVNKWCLPFPGDLPVAVRTQRYFYDNEGRRPVQVQTYLAFETFFKALSVTMLAVEFGLMVMTPYTRKLLLNHPSCFSFGWATHEGPTEEACINTKFQMTFFGRGWPDKKETPEVHTEPPNKTMTTRISGSDPTYGVTSLALVLSAVTVLKESDKMPGKGGVYPPGAAFAKTSMLAELQKHGLTVEILSS